MTACETRAREILARQLKTEPALLRPEQRLREDLGADSLDLIELHFRPFLRLP